MPRFVKETQVSTVWRFYVSQDRKWQWQQLNTNHAVILESRTGYSDYEECVAAAQGKGYGSGHSQAKKTRR
jgi:hypothetical protein